MLDRVMLEPFGVHVLPRLFVLLAFATTTACTAFFEEQWSDHRPCSDGDPIYGGVWYQDGRYLDRDGRPFAVAGEGAFDDCTEIRGLIALGGVIDDFSDFDHIVAVGGFARSSPYLPEKRGSCGVVSGFNAVERITNVLQVDDASLPVGGDICFFLEGFESLRFIEGDLNCGYITPEIANQLVEITGSTGCPNHLLLNLEKVGRVSLDGSPMPKLREANDLYAVSAIDGGRYEYPLLERVTARGFYGGKVIAGGVTTQSIDFSSLVHVDGDLNLAGAYFNIDVGVNDEEKPAFVRSLYDHVYVGGVRSICYSTPNDPCPGHPECESIYGEGSLECCNKPWPTCLEAVQE